MTVEQNRTSAAEDEDLSQIIKIDEAKVSGHLSTLVRQTVQETLNEMLDAEAQAMCNAQRYERTKARQDCRAGFYQRKLQRTLAALDGQVAALKLDLHALRQCYRIICDSRHFKCSLNQ